MYFYINEAVLADSTVPGNAQLLKDQDLNNNHQCPDLSDLAEDLPLRVQESKQVLQRTQNWEHSSWPGGNDKDSVGFPTVVKNVYGPNADNKYYLFYAHHDPGSGIGCAVADSIDGPYRKLNEVDSARMDSRVLSAPVKAGQPYHFSSPWVIWNEDEQCWFMYFHFYEQEWAKGRGHQKTALAICSNLKQNDWRPLVNPDGSLVVVLPVTRERWMNSQSTYHSIHRLRDGTWLAFMRGTGGEYTSPGKWVQDPCKLGFAKSRDGVHWDYFPENPIIYQSDGRGGRQGVYRNNFVAYLGGSQYLLCWAESNLYDAAPRHIYGKTSDFKKVEQDKRGYADWPVDDGAVAAWREGNKLYLFSGKFVHIMQLPVKGTVTKAGASQR
jgi:hypothetical protein